MDSKRIFNGFQDSKLCRTQPASNIALGPLQAICGRSCIATWQTYQSRRLICCTNLLFAWILTLMGALAVESCCDRPASNSLTIRARRTPTSNRLCRPSSTSNHRSSSSTRRAARTEDVPCQDHVVQVSGNDVQPPLGPPEPRQLVQGGLEGQGE